MKAKTRSAAKKRIRFTARGKIKIMKAGRKHLLQQKSMKQRRMGKVGKAYMLSQTFKRHVLKALPNNF